LRGVLGYLPILTNQIEPGRRSGEPERAEQASTRTYRTTAGTHERNMMATVFGIDPRTGVALDPVAGPHRPSLPDSLTGALNRGPLNV
jgi:hypothetical protein